MTGDLSDITLDDLVSISPLPAAAALHALHDVAATLEAIHDSGLVHGDLRPSTSSSSPTAGRARPARGRPPPANGRRSRQDDAHEFAVLAFEVLTGPLDLAGPRWCWRTRGRECAALTIDAGRRPFPHALMVALDAIPAEDWPTNGLHRPADHARSPRLRDLWSRPRRPRDLPVTGPRPPVSGPRPSRPLPPRAVVAARRRRG